MNTLQNITQNTQQTSQHGTQSEKTCNLTTQTTRTLVIQVKIGDRLGCTRMASHFCSTGDTRRVTLATNK